MITTSTLIRYLLDGVSPPYALLRSIFLVLLLLLSFSKIAMAQQACFGNADFTISSSSGTNADNALGKLSENQSKDIKGGFSALNSGLNEGSFEKTLSSIENGDIDVDFGIWDGFWDIGDPNTHTQSLQLTYDLPLNKIPTFSFINATYSYTGDFNWQRGSDVLREVSGERLNPSGGRR